MLQLTKLAEVLCSARHHENKHATAVKAAGRTVKCWSTLCLMNSLSPGWYMKKE